MDFEITEMIERRNFLSGLGLGLLGSFSLTLDSHVSTGNCTPSDDLRIPVIDITDLYHPHQDVGDNLDLIAAYALPEIDLKAIILDATEPYRHRGTQGQLPGYQDATGPREPGIIPVAQLNYIFDRNIPFGMTPFTPLKSPNDQALDAPQFQQSGIELILKVLHESLRPVEILSFGSARALAITYNREPDLMRRKVKQIHLAAGASSPEYLEWNVMLDPHAMVCLLQSDVPIAIYPCATAEGATAYGVHNSYWQLTHLNFIRNMHFRLQNYLIYAFERSNRSDFLGMLEEVPSEESLDRICSRSHNVWETALWAQASRRELVQRADGHYRLIPRTSVDPTDIVLQQDLVPCHVQVDDNGTFTFELTATPGNFTIYQRQDPKLNEVAFREALPALFESFKIKK